jgi:GNAT superfamily N-acetyltransferase
MIKFRKAEIEDASAIVTLVNSAYRGEEAKVGWTTEAYILDGQRTDSEKIIEMIQNPGSMIGLAVEDDVILGCINIQKESNSVYFGMLTVKPSLQAKGLGKQLLIYMEDLTKTWGYKKVRMTVIEGRKELLEFYERRGYQATGMTEPFPEDPRYGLPKSKLILRVFEKILSE